MSLVEVRPLKIKTWHGLDEKENFTQAKVIEALYDVMTGGYATGLTKEEEEKYAKETGFDLSSRFDPDKPHPFWGSAAGRIKLPNHTVILDTTKALDYVKVKMLKASKYVANSIKEWESGMFPNATHVIFDENEEVEVKASKIQLKNKAVIIAAKLTADEKSSLIQILSSKTVRGKSNDFMDVEIDKIVESKPGEFIRYAKMDKQELNVRSAILEAIYKNVLLKEGTAVYYMGERLGSDFEDVVTYFMDPQNQKQKVSILEKLIK